MEEKGKLTRWLARLFIWICIAVTIASVTVYLAERELVPAQITLLFSLSICFCIFILQRQSGIAADLKFLKSNAVDLEEYEQDMEKRLNRLTQLIETKAVPDNSSNQQQIGQITHVLTALDKRMMQMETAALISRDEAETATSSIAPSIKEIEPVVAKAPEIKQTAASTLDRTKLRSALDGDNLSLHLQPIVQLPTRKPAYFESFMRLKLGENEYMEAEQFLKVAESGGLMPMIDKKVLFSSVRMLRTLGALKKRAGLFCNISDKTLSQARGFEQCLSFLEANRALSGSLVIEISQRRYRALNTAEKQRLGEIVDLGYSLSLDQTLDLNLNPKQLASVGFRFVKIPASILLYATFSDEKDGIHPASLSHELKEHGLSLIATEVEQENDVMTLIDFDVSYGQGLLFAPPRPVKAQLLESPKDTDTSSKKGRIVTHVPPIAIAN